MIAPSGTLTPGIFHLRVTVFFTDGTPETTINLSYEKLPKYMIHEKRRYVYLGMLTYAPVLKVWPNQRVKIWPEK